MSNSLKQLIVKSLRDQGFVIRGNHIQPPSNLDKEELRRLHAVAVRHQVEVAGRSLARVEDELLSHIASGSSISPAKFDPYLVLVTPRSDDELLFRYAARHWSIPVSAGYGRRLRFLVRDRQNEKLVGLFGLADPVFGLRARDHWIGWNRDAQRQRLRNVMDAYVLGAVPPYSFLLAGKLVAMMTSATEVRREFEKQYVGIKSRISGRVLKGGLALITTTSALGRSSIYNRIHLGTNKLFHSVGFTEGSGDFHFANGVYKEMAAFAEENCIATAKQAKWGVGFRNRREVIKKCLSSVGLSSDLVYHGVRREVFVVPLAVNTREYLRGEDELLHQKVTNAQEIAEVFRERWLLPRSTSDFRYKSWNPEDWRLWPKGQKANA